MNKRHIYDQDRHAHFVTFSCYGRRKLLDDNQAKRIVVGTLGAQLASLAGRCAGFVIMPNHVHAIVWFEQPNCLSEFMQQWKRLTSFRLTELFTTRLSHYGKLIAGTPVWQDKYYDVNLNAEENIEEKLTYMHQNPVRAGFVEKSIDWRFSSARYYELGKSVGVKVGWLD